MLIMMKTFLVMTILGPDRAGLVSELSSAIAEFGGNWLESRMARLAGQFAGILRVECPEESVNPLIGKLRSFEGISIQAVREEAHDGNYQQTLSIDVIGNDRPGIVRQLAAAIASAGGNVEQLVTGLESAPMSGHPLFRAHGVISLAKTSDADTLIAAIEKLGPDLTVDVKPGES